MTNFYNLHLHTNLGSPYDALGTPKEWVDAAVGMGIDTMAVTEHGNMNSLAEFVLSSQEQNKNGVRFKPIYGVEFYVIKSLQEWQHDKELHESFSKSKKKGNNPVPLARLRHTSHLVVWAKNPTGLRNLFHLVSLSHKEPYFYRKPRIDLKLLMEHSDGLAGSNACMGGVLGSLVRRLSDQGANEYDIFGEVNKLNSFFLRVFGDGNWFNEIQWNGFEDQHRLNSYVLKSAKDLGIPVITTVDSHYIHPKYWKHREFYYAMKYLRGEEEEKITIPDDFESTKMDLSLKTFDRVLESFHFYSKGRTFYDDYNIVQTIENTGLVVDAVEAFFPDQSPKMPNFIMEQYSKEPIEEIRDICFDELASRGLDSAPYRDRVETELNVIETRGFGRYFLVMKEIVNKAKSSWLTGPGRGSAAGSLVSYLLGITQVDR